MIRKPVSWARRTSHRAFSHGTHHLEESSVKTVKQHTVKEVREALVGIRLSERAGWERGWHRHNEKRLSIAAVTAPPATLRPMRNRHGKMAYPLF